MADPTQTFKLTLDMGQSSQVAASTAKSLDQVKASAQGAAVDLRQLETASLGVSAASTKAMGAPGASGSGLMGASYAIQDFTSVLTGGGGIARALGAVTNNFDQLAKAAGATVSQAAALSIGFTGFVALLPVVTPLLQRAWESLGGGPGGSEKITKALDAADARLHSMAERAEAIAKSFEKMATAATKAETKGAKGLEQVITEAPTEAITSGLTGAIAGTEFGAKLNEATRNRIAALEAARDAALLAKDREFAQAELDKLILEAKKVIVTENRKRAAALMGEAVQPGAPGEGARQRIADIAGRFPGQFPEGFAGAVQAASPEAVRRQEQFEKQLEVNKQVQERIKRAVEARNQAAEEKAKGGIRGDEEAKRQKDEHDRKEQEAFAEQQRVQKQMDDQAERDKDKARQEDQKRIREEDQRIKAGEQRDRQFEAARRRNVQQAPVAQLEQATSQLSQNLGYGTPNAAEANQMADAALQNINDGVNAQQAVWLAVMQKVEAIKMATARANGQLGQMQKQTQSGLGN
jgi:hypothetical protein